MKTKDKPKEKMNENKDKKIILWEVNSFPPIEINIGEEEREEDKNKD